jgi:acyl-CoA synthetase (AMP-forming)/AMP-acid ligase II
MVLRYAGYLHSTLKVVPGEVIAIDFMNSPQFIFLTMALWSLGATPAFVNYNLSGNAFVHSVKTFTARICKSSSQLDFLRHSCLPA